MIARLLAVTLVLASPLPISDDGKVAASSFLPVASAKDESPAASDKAKPASRPSKCEIRLELPAKMNKESHGVGKLEIKNVGKTEVTLVMPGDGSDCRWRTPIVGWSLLPADSKTQHPKAPPRRGGGRCGNINALKPKEVFTLEPGDAKELTEWTGFPSHLSPGRYRVVFYYSNEPNLKWSGIPLGKHDQVAMRRLKNSTPISLVSNEVQIEVTE